MDEKTVRKRAEYRLMLLERIYEITQGASNHWVALVEQAKVDGIPEEEARLAYQFLVDKRYLQPMGSGYRVAMTVAGVEYMDKIIEQRQGQRYALLRELFRVADGRVDVGITPEDLSGCAKNIGLAARDLDGAVHYLTNEGLLRRRTIIGTVSLTQDGVNEVEDSIRRPEESTGHFSESVIQYVTNNFQFNSAVGAVQTGANATSNVVQNLGAGEEVMVRLAELRRIIEGIDGDKRTDAMELVDTLEEQAKSSSPKKGLIRQCGEGLKGLVAPLDIVPLITTIITLLTK